MNNTIKDLLPNPYSVDYQHDPTGFDLYTEVEMIQFAELIVKECASFIENKFDFSGDEIYAAEELKKYFGVTE